MPAIDLSGDLSLLAYLAYQLHLQASLVALQLPLHATHLIVDQVYLLDALNWSQETKWTLCHLGFVRCGMGLFLTHGTLSIGTQQISYGLSQHFATLYAHCLQFSVINQEIGTSGQP